MADALDILTPDEAKRAINKDVASDDQDDVLARHVTAISRLMDNRCGSIVQRQIDDEVHPGGTPTIILYHRPVSELVIEESMWGTVTTLTEATFGSTVDGYLAPTWPADPALLSGALRRWRYGCDDRWGQTRVSYLAGRFVDTESVDARFKDAAAAVLRRLWKREAGSWAQSSNFYEDADQQAGTGFFRVAMPVIEEMLPDEIRRDPLIA